MNFLVSLPGRPAEEDELPSSFSPCSALVHLPEVSLLPLLELFRFGILYILCGKHFAAEVGVVTSSGMLTAACASGAAQLSPV